MRIAWLALLSACFIAARPATSVLAANDSDAVGEVDSASMFALNGPASPAVFFGLSRSNDALVVAVSVAAFDARFPQPLVELGVAAAKNVRLKSSSAKVTTVPQGTLFTWRIRAADLVQTDQDWSQLRLALAIRWPSTSGADAQRERFRCSDHGAAHADLPADSSNWAPLSLAEYDAKVADRRLTLSFDVEQPMDGKLTVAIDAADGHRVRNLISGQSEPRGVRHVSWDGLDDSGKAVPPGAYHWRSISHPGITPHYLFSFYNNGKPPWRDGSPGSLWLADHGDPVAAAACGDRLYFGAPIAESGHTIMQLTPDGVKTAGVNMPATIGFGTIFLAADDHFFYALSEGFSHYGDVKQDLPGGKWRVTRPASLVRWDLQGKIAGYKNGGTNIAKVLAENPYEGSGTDRNPHVPNPDNLGGAAMFEGRLYVSLRKENRILIVDPATGETTGDLKLTDPGLLAADRTSLIALSSDTLVRIDPKTGAARPLFKPALSNPMEFPPAPGHQTPDQVARLATGLAVGSAGEFFVCDNGIDQNVKVFSADGNLLRVIGRKGGRPLTGTWDPSGMYQPHGIALDSRGQLWVTETDVQPKRISVWDATTGAFRREFLGPAHYGSPGGGFDTDDASRWIGGGVLWNLDMAAHTALPVADLYHASHPGEIQDELPSISYTFCHQDGRTFLLGQGGYESVYELKADGSLKLWAVCGTIHFLADYPRWQLPAAFGQLPALKEFFAGAVADTTGQFRDHFKAPETGMDTLGSALWVDRNGDGIVQPDEIELSDDRWRLIFNAWGAGNSSLDLKFASGFGEPKKPKTPLLVELKPDGFLPSGAPNYHLAAALAAARPMQLLPAGERSGNQSGASIQDRFGRLLVNASPMAAYDDAGKLLWTYPNNWVDVGGSHEAPLPETGVIQGVLWFLGTAPLDKHSEVTVINGNHGRFFVMTTDGLYLDEMFKDIRVTQKADAYLIGGECFGGYFGRNKIDGNYYLQSGHTDYRVFQIDGLADIHRGEGTIDVSPEQSVAAQKNLERNIAAAQAGRSATVLQIAAGDPLDADPANWPGDWTATWGDARRAFPFAQAKILRQGDQLHLAYRVKDPSPFVNNGTDWMLLFKTGDSVNFEFSTDSSARPDRSTPTVGDRRLLIAPFQGKPIAVLYSYKDTATTQPVPFSSPWRTINVDKVTRLDSARIQIKHDVSGYTLTASLSLADLGLPSSDAMALKGDFGVIYGDEAGSIDVLRSYWSNQATGLVNDVPGEVTVNPQLWGLLRFQEGK